MASERLRQSSDKRINQNGSVRLVLGASFDHPIKSAAETPFTGRERTALLVEAPCGRYSSGTAVYLPFPSRPFSNGWTNGGKCRPTTSATADNDLPKTIGDQRKGKKGFSGETVSCRCMQAKRVDKQRSRSCQSRFAPRYSLQTKKGVRQCVPS